MNENELDKSDFKEFVRRVVELERGIGLAIGALSVIEISPHSFAAEGVSKVLKELKEIAKMDEVEND